MASEIRASDADLGSIIRDFNKKLDAYLDRMKDNMSSFNEAIGFLRQYWSSEDYEEFKRQMLKQNAIIEQELEKGSDLRDLLEQKAKELDIIWALMKGVN